MIELLLVTNADPKRPGLSYKINFESEVTYRSWLSEYMWLPEAADKVMIDGEDTTTVIINLSDNMIPVRYCLNWTQVAVLLQLAIDLPRSGGLRPGRPESRVLLSNTSKDRRAVSNKRTW